MNEKFLLSYAKGQSTSLYSCVMCLARYGGTHGKSAYEKAEAGELQSEHWLKLQPNPFFDKLYK